MQYTKFLRWGVIGGLVLTLCIPFIVSEGTLFPNMFFPFITGKNFSFRILVELLLGLYLLLAIRDPKYRPHGSSILWTLLAFTAWMGVATIFSVDPIKSFWGNFERMEGYLTVLHLFVYFIIAGAVITAEKWWDKLFQVSILLATLEALFSLAQLLHIGGLAPSSQSGPRLDGTFGNAIYLAVYMLFNVFLTLFMLLRQRSSQMAQIVYGISLVLQIATLYFTETRGSLLGMIGGFIITALFIVWRAKTPEWKLLRKISLWGVCTLAVLMILFVAIRNAPFIKNYPTLERVASISLADRTTVARFQIWQMALEGFKDKPILGWGQENFNFVFNEYYQPSMFDQEQWFDRAHNQFLDWLIAGGLPAFGLYLALFVLAVLIIVRSDALSVPEQAILLGLIAGYAFNNLFVFDDLMSSVYFILILALVHGFARVKPPRLMFMTRPASDNTVAIVAPIVTVVVLLGAWSLNAPGIARAEEITSALQTQTTVNGASVAKTPAQALQQFETTLGDPVWPGTPMGKQEATEQLLQFAVTEAQNTSIDPATKQDIFNAGQAAGQQIITVRPHDARLELFLGAFYSAFGQQPQALSAYDAALSDSPGKQQIMYQIGLLYLNSGDTQDALTILKQAYEEDTGDSDALVYYVTGLYYAGDNTDADALLIKQFGTVIVDNPQLLQAYLNTKQYDRVAGVWKNRIAASPNDPQNYVGLASVYFAEGDKADTISTLQKAASIDPTDAAQIQSLITQIQNGTLKPGQ